MTDYKKNKNVPSGLRQTSVTIGDSESRSSCDQNCVEGEAASSFCPFAPFESSSLASGSEEPECRRCGDIDRVIKLEAH